MRVHHLNCGSFCPRGKRLVNREGDLLERALVVCHCLAVETGGDILLVDTGFGSRTPTTPGGSAPSRGG